MFHVLGIVCHAKAISIEGFGTCIGEVVSNKLDITKPPDARVENAIEVLWWHLD